MAVGLAHIKFPIRLPSGGTAIPVGGVADTTEGLGGFLGFYNTSDIEITEEMGSTLVAGVRIETSGGSFDVLEVGDESEEAEHSYEVTVSRHFEEATSEPAQNKLAATFIQTGASWDGVAAKRLENTVLLTPGIYHVNVSATLSETYEFDQATLPEVEVLLVAVKFEEHYFTDPAGTPCVGLKSYTDYDLFDGSVTKTPYEFPEGEEPPIALDFISAPYDGNLVDFLAYLIARSVGGLPAGHQRPALAGLGYIRASTGASGYTTGWQKEWEEFPGGSGDAAGGGAIDTQQTTKNAVGRLCFECAYDFDWTAPDARLIRIPRGGTLTPDKTITIDDIKRVAEDDPTPRLSIGWTPEADMINVFNPRFMRDYSQSAGQFSSYETPGTRQTGVNNSMTGDQENAPMFWFDWLRDLSIVTEVVTAWNFHYRVPKHTVQFTGFLNLLGLERGDIINFDVAPNITIGPEPGEPDENQGYGEGGYGDGGYGGQVISPPGTIIGDALIPTNLYFMVDGVSVNWPAKEVVVSGRRAL